MTQFLKKNAKLFYILFGVFAFFFIVLSCFYMTPYNKIAIDYNPDFDITGEAKRLLGLSTFVSNTKATTYGYLYALMYDTNKALQLGNNMILYLGVVSLVMLAIMLICANATRKKFYISNLVSGIACPAVCIILGIVAIVTSAQALGAINSEFDLINWGSLANADLYDQAVEWYKAGDTSHYIISLTPLIIYIVLVILFIVASAALIAYNVYRYLDTQKQLQASKAQENLVDNTLNDSQLIDAQPEGENQEVLSQEKVVDANV